VAAKKKAPAKRPAKKSTKKVVKKVAAKKPAKKSGSATARKSSAKKTVKKSATKKSASKKSAKTGSRKVSAARVEAAKIQIPPVPSRGTTSVSSTPAAAKVSTPNMPTAPAKKSSPTVLILVVVGIVLLAIFALSNNTSDDAAPTPTASESVEPSQSPSADSSADPMLTSYEAPTGFVAINNSAINDGNGGVTLRWKASTAMEGLTGYSVSISYNAKDFSEVASLPADTLSYDIALAGDEGGTQFLLQSVYSDGTKVDAKKFSLKGKYSN